jgi:hypothetical protein
VIPEDNPIRLQRVTFWGSTLLSTAQRSTEPNVNMREPKVLKEKSIKVPLLYFNQFKPSCIIRQLNTWHKVFLEN